MKKLISLVIFVASILSSCKQEILYKIITTVQPEGSGSVIITPSSGAILEGTSVSFLAKPNGDYVFSGWSGGISGTNNPQTITVSSDISVVATFALRTYPLSVTVEGEGSVAEKVISTKTDYSSGTVVELTAQPSEYWLFDHWEGDLNGNTNPAQIAVSSSKAVKAVFVEKDPGIRYTETVYVSPQMLFEKLGWGFNLCCHLNGFAPDAAHAQIPGWVNSQTLNQMMATVVKMGAKTVRLQITFCGELGPAPDFVIDADWLSKIDLYIDTCERHGLNVIIDVMAEALDPSDYPNPVFVVDYEGAANDPEIYEFEKTRLNAIWLQLSRRYRDRGDFLIFESFNEPCTLSGGAYPDVLNKLNQEFVNTVRSTGGNNAGRWLSVPGWWCSPEDALNTLDIPDDYTSNNRIIVPFHYYGGLFNDENWVEWGHTATIPNPDLWVYDEVYLADMFERLKERYVDNGIPVIMSETGCFNGENERQYAYEMYYLEYVFRCAALKQITPLLHTVDGPRYREDYSGIQSENGNYGFYDFERQKYRPHGEEIQTLINKAFYSTDPTYTLEYIYNNAPFQNEIPVINLDDHIDDKALLSYLLTVYDQNQDGNLSFGEIMRIRSLDLSGLNLKEIKGLDVLPALSELSCYGSGDKQGVLEYVDVSGMAELRNLNVKCNRVSRLHLDNKKLVSLNCAHNPVDELDLACLPKLEWLDCCGMQITELDLSNNPLLKELRCHTNQLNKLDLSHNPELTFVDCYSTPITELDVSHNTKLEALHLWDCSNLAIIYMSKGQVIPDLVIDSHTKIVYR